MRELAGYLYALGMGGQGYMLGSSVGVLLTHMVQNAIAPEDQEVLDPLSPYRPFGGAETLK